MGRRWWQKEARRLQNEEVADTSIDSASTEKVIDVDEHIESASEAVDELVELVASIDEQDDVVESETETVSDDASDDTDLPEEVAAEIETSVATSQPGVSVQKNFNNNKKKKWK